MKEEEEEMAVRTFHPWKLLLLDKTLDFSLELLSLHSVEELIELCPGYDVSFFFFLYFSQVWRSRRSVLLRVLKFISFAIITL